MERETILGLVKGALSQDSRCRNDDKYLVYTVFCRMLPEIKKISFNDWAKLPAPDTIKRFRADLQNSKGLYLPNEETRLKRISNAKSYRAFFKDRNR